MTAVSLEKVDPDGEDEPGGEIVLRPDDELALAQPALPVLAARRVQTLYVRARQRTARATLWTVDHPAVVRSWAVTTQAPRAAGRLLWWTPRGAARAVGLVRGYLFATGSEQMLGRLADSDSPEWRAAAAEHRQQHEQRATRRWLMLLAGLLAGLYGLALWAPQAFAGLLAAGVALLVFVVGRSVCSRLLDVAVLAVVAAGGGWLAWHFGPDLAGVVPRLPGWVGLVAAGLLVVAFGLLGRRDAPLIDLPNVAMHDADRHDRPSAGMVIDALCRIGVTGMTLAAADRVREEIRVRAPGVGRSTRGYTIELELPPGVTAAAVMEQREELAGALRRKLGCVWPSRGRDHPGHLRLFLSDVPMATAPQPRWPMEDGHAIDVFDPIPLVTDQEGEWVDLDVSSTHTVIAGASGFGKSVVLRHLAVALAFDPRARLYCFDGKISGDLDPVRKVAHAYHEGADDEDVAAQLAEFRGLEKEMRRRARFLRNLPPEERSPKVTSALASRYPDLSPIFVLIDECQEYTEYGTKGVKEEMAIRTEFRTIITRISRLGRSAAIFLVPVSQKPDAEVLPTAIMGNCSNRLCFKVTEQNHNDQVLGTGAYKSGLKATLFSTDDRGLAWLKAAGDPQVVRGWSEMVDVQTAVDLIETAYQLRVARGLLTGQAAGDDGELDAEIVYDLLADAEHVMRQRQRGRAQWVELLPWLQELRAAHYAELTVEGLSARMREDRVKVSQVRVDGTNRQGVRLSDLQERGGSNGEEEA